MEQQGATDMKIFTKSLNIPITVLCLMVCTGTGFAQQKVAPNLWQKAQAEGAIKVIVELTVPWRSDVKLHSSEMLTQNKAIAAAQNQLLAELAGTHYKVIKRLELVPVIALEVNSYVLTLLSHSDIVATVTENQSERLQRLQRAPFHN
jgi:hypothetical protein